MKIAVFGVGAMGSLYAGLFAKAGHEVHAIDPWSAHIDAINAHGLRIEGASGSHTISNLRATTHAQNAADCDLYIIATKAHFVAAAARDIASLLAKNSTVLTIQNGIGAERHATLHLPETCLMLGVADGFGARVVAPGRVFHSAMKRIRLGELGDGMTPRLQRLVEIWSGAGFNAQPYANIQQLIWEKYLCNVTFSAPCTVFDYTLGELMADAAAWRIACGCALEAFALAQKIGVRLAFAEPIEYVTKFGQRMPDARPSMLLDHHAQRVSEIDAINGMAVVLGRELGIPTPYNETLSALVHNREAKF